MVSDVVCDGVCDGVPEMFKSRSSAWLCGCCSVCDVVSNVMCDACDVVCDVVKDVVFDGDCDVVWLCVIFSCLGVLLTDRQTDERTDICTS